LTETADCIVGLPIYRAVKLIIKTPLNLSEIANHGPPAEKARKDIDPATVFCP
jgi:hypothetical protein